MIQLQLPPNKKIYFASDFHFGAPNFELSLQREKKIINWLSSIEKNAQAIFLVGDVFDFWFEYKKVVPKGFVRFLAKLAQLKENGIDIYIFSGNHDLWLNDYLQQEIGATVFLNKQILHCNNKQIFLAHGDGLGKGDTKYKFLKKIFTNPICKFLFRWLHPDIGIKIAQIWSRHSFTNPNLEKFEGEEKEWLIQFCKEELKTANFDFFVMGHRHLPMEILLNEKSKYINLGDWIVNSNYAVFDGENLQMQKFEN